MNGLRSGEGRRLESVQIKLAEAFEEIAAFLLSETGRDHKIWAGQRYAWSAPDAAIHHHPAKERLSAKHQQSNCAYQKQVTLLLHGLLFLCKNYMFAAETSDADSSHSRIFADSLISMCRGLLSVAIFGATN
jgi:hypothetical protein